MHGIILHEEYRDRMRKLSDEDLGKLVKNMFCIDEGEEPTPFGDEYLDFFSETVCGRVGRDIELSEKQRNNRLGKTKNNQKKPNDNQKQTKKNPNTNTNNQLPITNNNIRQKKSNRFVDSCSKSDIDFDSLEIKVVKN